MKDMFIGGVIQCPMCRYKTYFPTETNSDVAINSLAVNIELLSALKLDLGVNEYEMPNEELYIGLLRFNEDKHRSEREKFSCIECAQLTTLLTLAGFFLLVSCCFPIMVFVPYQLAHLAYYICSEGR